MNLPARFAPPRRGGILFHAAALLVLGAGSAAGLILAFRAAIGLDFLALLLAGLALLAPIPILAYRGYALIGARYDLDREGLRLRWGLRSEDIPLPDIEWVRPASDLTAPLPLPALRWPGVVRGVREVEGLGPIEFIASNADDLLLVATPLRIFAISPADPAGFIETFRRINELGSPAPLESRSIYPSFLLGRVWATPPARTLILAGLALGIALLVWVSLAIPTRAEVALGFTPQGAPLDPSPSPALLLLPVLDGLAYLIDLLGGLYFFRRPGQQAIAYVFWGAGAVTPLLLLIAVGFITL